MLKDSYERAVREKGARKSAERERLRPKVRALRAEGLTYKEIALRLGCSPNRVKLLESDAKWHEPRSRP